MLYETGFTIWQMNSPIFHCYEVGKLYGENLIIHSLCFKHLGLSKADTHT